MVNKYFNDWAFARKSIGKLMEQIKVRKIIQNQQVYVTIFGGDELNVFGCVPHLYRERVVKRCQMLVNDLIKELELHKFDGEDPEADVMKLATMCGHTTIEQMFTKYIFTGRF